MKQATNPSEMWIGYTRAAWALAEDGDYENALLHYQAADDIAVDIGASSPFWHNPELSLLRHRAGKADGIVRPLSPTEDTVLALQMLPDKTEGIDAYGMDTPKIDLNGMKGAIRNCNYDPGYHGENVTGLPHTMILSAGRSGTVSLYHLLERTQYLPYHTFFFQPSPEHRLEMACRLMGDNFDNSFVMDSWVKLRAAEWIGCENLNRPIAMLNHMDLVFAPVFAKIHENARFVYLYRDPEDLFLSFYSKNQWNTNQINSANYKFNPEFEWRYMQKDVPAAIAFHVRFTEVFCAAMDEVMPDRFNYLSADRLFNGDELETIHHREILSLELSKEEIMDHYKIPYNKKLHKVAVADDEVQPALESFRNAYIALGGEL